MTPGCLEKNGRYVNTVFICVSVKAEPGASTQLQFNWEVIPGSRTDWEILEGGTVEDAAVVKNRGSMP